MLNVARFAPSKTEASVQSTTEVLVARPGSKGIAKIFIQVQYASFLEVLHGLHKMYRRQVFSHTRLLQIIGMETGGIHRLVLSYKISFLCC